MGDLYLVAHRVRGEPAFDIATQMECPHCLEAYEVTGDMGCDECDMLGYWWIIPTSGHRAYPWWWIELDLMGTSDHLGEFDPLAHMGVGEMPPDLQDHYHLEQTVRTNTPTLLSRLNLHRTQPPIIRRI